jgi:hypothetical protein
MVAVAHGIPSAASYTNTFVQRAQRLSILQQLTLWLAFIPISFDVKGEEAEGTLPIVATLLSLLGGVLAFLVIPAAPRETSGPLRFTIRLWFFYLFSTAVVAFVQGVAIENYLRVLLPFAMFGGTMVIGRRLANVTDLWSAIRTPMIVSALVAVAFRMYYSLNVVGVSMDVMRYQICSPIVWFLSGYGAWAIFFSRSTPWKGGIALLAAGVPIAISITRSNLLMIMAGCVSAFFLQLQASRYSVAKPLLPRLTSRFALFFLVSAAGLLVSLIARPDMMENWIKRLTEQKTGSTGEDVTALTRMAEYSGQWELVSDGFTSLLIGRGLGATYAWDLSRYPELSRYIRGSRAPEHSFMGHSTYVYSLFTSGILFGWLLPVILFYGLYRSFQVATAFASYRDSIEFGPIAPLAFIILIQLVPLTFTMHVLGDRIAAIYVGVVYSLACVSGIQSSSVAGRPAPTG